MKYALILLVFGLTGCFAHQGPMHWKDGTGWKQSDSSLLCDSNGAEIVVVTHDGDSQWQVFGGNGKSYGTFETLVQAKHQAETIGADPELFGRRWTTCPPTKDKE